MLGLRRLRLRQLEAVARSVNASTIRANSSSTTTTTTTTVKSHGPDVLVTPSILKPRERKESAFPQPKPKSPTSTSTEAGALSKPKPKINSNRNPNYYASRASSQKKRLPKKRLQAILRRIRNFPRKRPDISVLNPRKWNRALAEGIVPAYDEALKVIYKDSRKIKGEIGEIEKRIQGMVDEVKEKKVRLEEVVKREGVKAGECVREVRETQLGENGEEQVVVRMEVVNEKVYQARKAFEEVDNKLEALREKMNILQVQSEVNLPKVRWEVANAMGNVRKPSHRHLLEQRWRDDGKLDLLMERIYQMNIVPDIVPAIHPTIDLDVTVTLPTSRLLRSRKRVYLTEPGRFISPSQTLKPPTLFPHAYHTDTRLYTLLMIDPDVPHPDPTQKTFTSYLHWMKPNIPISAVSSELGALKGLNDHTMYVPPHPQKGTAYHRYTILLLLQPPRDEVRGYSRNVEWEGVERVKEAVRERVKARAEGVEGQGELITTSKFLPIPVVKDSERVGFDVRRFCQQWGLFIGSTRGTRAGKDVRDKHASSKGWGSQDVGGVGRKRYNYGGGAVHMFREVWDETVSGIYENWFGRKEPRFGIPPRYDPYEEVKGRKRYVLQGKGEGLGGEGKE